LFYKHSREHIATNEADLAGSLSGKLRLPARLLEVAIIGPEFLSGITIKRHMSSKTFQSLMDIRVESNSKHPKMSFLMFFAPGKHILLPQNRTMSISQKDPTALLENSANLGCDRYCLVPVKAF